MHHNNTDNPYAKVNLYGPGLARNDVIMKRLVSQNTEKFISDAKHMTSSQLP